MLETSWRILLELAPWLLLGMAIAGVLHLALPRDYVRRRLSGRGGVLRAVMLGVPLPLCSCGVIPAGLGLKKDGASSGAAVGFLISTPQTGVDSVLVGASFLGWPFALFKVVSAAVTGLVGGWISDRVEPAADESGPDSTPGIAEPRRTVADGARHSIEILRSIWRWVVFGVLASAAIEVFVPEGFLTGLSELGTVVPMFAALLISLPLYVCATASVPIAAALVAGGMPAGAAMVFLMAGPATNIATMGAVSNALGRRSFAVYLTTIIGGSVGAGLLFDVLLDSDAVVLPHGHTHQQWWAVASAILLLAMIAWFAASDLRGLMARAIGSRGPRQADAPADPTSCHKCASGVGVSTKSESGSKA